MTVQLPKHIKSQGTLTIPPTNGGSQIPHLQTTHTAPPAPVHPTLNTLPKLEPKTPQPEEAFNIPSAPPTCTSQPPVLEDFEIPVAKPTPLPQPPTISGSSHAPERPQSTLPTNNGNTYHITGANATIHIHQGESTGTESKVEGQDKNSPIADILNAPNLETLEELEEKLQYALSLVNAKRTLIEAENRIKG